MFVGVVTKLHSAVCGCVMCSAFFLFQELKKIIHNDITMIGKENGLHSFEQVHIHTSIITPHYTHTHTHRQRL